MSGPADMDFGVVFDEHVADEFELRDVDRTMTTMTDSAYVAHEHIYWDQATALVQTGILNPSGLPVVGAEQARKVLETAAIPSHQLIASGAARSADL